MSQTCKTKAPIRCLNITPMSSWDELWEFVQNHAKFFIEDDYTVVISFPDEEDDNMDLNMGDWLVFIGDDLEVYSDEAFNATFALD